MRTSKRKKIAGFISWLVVVALIVVAVGFIKFYTQDFTSDFATFYVEHDGTTILKKAENVNVKTATPSRFDCKYTFSMVSSSLKGYKLNIVPCVKDENDFDFTVEGIEYPFLFSAEKDLTDGFEVEYFDDYFIIVAPNSIKAVLERIYGQTVTIDGDIKDVDYFTMIVTSSDGKSAVSISFRLYVVIEEIIFNNSTIVI